MELSGWEGQLSLKERRMKNNIVYKTRTERKELSMAASHYRYGRGKVKKTLNDNQVLKRINRIVKRDNLVYTYNAAHYREEKNIWCAENGIEIFFFRRDFYVPEELSTGGIMGHMSLAKVNAVMTPEDKLLYDMKWE